MLGLSGLFALALAVLCCEKARLIGRLLGVMDRPDGARKLHGQATPMVGGLALAFPLLVIQVTWLAGHPSQERLFIALIIATAAFWLLAFIDEKMDVSRALIPRFNMLTVFDGLRVHSVSAVADFAPAPRLSIVGWFRDDPPPGGVRA